MIEIDYTFTGEFEEDPSNIAIADDTDLHYQFFLRDITLKDGNTDLSAHWGWVPILDFLACVMSIIDSLDTNQTQEFEFTESDATITFERTENTVHISASYAPGVINIEHLELRAVLLEVSKRLVADIKVRYPTIKDNEYFDKESSLLHSSD